MRKWLLKKLDIAVDATLFAAVLAFILWLLDANITINL